MLWSLLGTVVTASILALCIVGAISGLTWARGLDTRRLGQHRRELWRTGELLGLAATDQGASVAVSAGMLHIDLVGDDTLLWMDLGLAGVELSFGRDGNTTGDARFDRVFRGSLVGRGQGWISEEVRQLFIEDPKPLSIHRGRLNMRVPGHHVRPATVERLIARFRMLASALVAADGDLAARLRSDPVVMVRASALKALGRVDPPRAVSVARERLLVEEDPALRVELAGVGDVDAVLLAAVGDPNLPPALRARAAAWTRDARPEALQLLLGGTMPELWLSAVDLVVERPGPAVVDALIPTLSWRWWGMADRPLRLTLLAVLVQWDRPALPDALSLLLEDADVRVQDLAVDGLGRFGLVAHVGALRRHLMSLGVLEGARAAKAQAAIAKVQSRGGGARGALSIPEVRPEEGALSVPESARQG